MNAEKHKVCDRECKHCVKTVLDDLGAIEDGTERLEYLVDMAKELPCLQDDFKKDHFKVKGCVSSLWIVPELKDGRCYFHCDCDAVIPKGIGFILAALHSDLPPEEILKLDLECVKEIGLEKYLSPNRRNALSQVTETIRNYAREMVRKNGDSLACGKGGPLHCLQDIAQQKSDSDGQDGKTRSE